MTWAACDLVGPLGFYIRPSRQNWSGGAEDGCLCALARSTVSSVHTWRKLTSGHGIVFFCSQVGMLKHWNDVWLFWKQAYPLRHGFSFSELQVILRRPPESVELVVEFWNPPANIHRLQAGGTSEQTAKGENRIPTTGLKPPSPTHPMGTSGWLSLGTIQPTYIGCRLMELPSRRQKVRRFPI